MEITIDSLSSQELELYNYTVSLQEMTDMDDIDKKLKEDGVFSQYRHIHKCYLDLFFNTEKEETKLEILKRLVFLNWYGIIEPGFFTGIKDLDSSIIFESYSILNEYLLSNKIDKEFKWMLSYYCSWDFAILPFSENNLSALTKFVKEVDTSILHAPKKEVLKGAMDNRGQMGIYWKSCSVEKD
jgi:hypothetical protein